MATEESDGRRESASKALFLFTEMADVEKAVIEEFLIHGTTELYERVLRVIRNVKDNEQEALTKALQQADRAATISEMELTWCAIKQDLELIAEEVGGEEAMDCAKNASAHIWSLIELAIKQGEEPCTCGL